ncbi:CAP domain-containing protein, partial [Patescibacteria group bacterium]|nr:CAP domain-containing protein [Patescibacteria group bacterium]
AVDMINKNYFSHRSPDGRLPWDFILEQGYDYLLLGENLAMDWPTPNDAVTAWMQSPTHKRNIVSYEFTETGIAAVAYKNSYLIVQIFGQESDIMISSEQNVINAEKQSNPVIQKSEQHLLPSFIETDNLNNQSTFATNIISNKENSENMSVLGASNWSTANVNPANKNPNFLLPFLVFSFFPISMALYLKVQAVHEII